MIKKSWFPCVLFLLACASKYQPTEATITNLEIVNTPGNGESHFIVSVEYAVEGETCSDQFKMNMSRMVEDSLSTPAPGIRFQILYNPKNPRDNKIDFNVKANRIIP